MLRVSNSNRVLSEHSGEPTHTQAKQSNEQPVFVLAHVAGGLSHFARINILLEYGLSQADLGQRLDSATRHTTGQMSVTDSTTRASGEPCNTHLDVLFLVDVLRGSDSEQHSVLAGQNLRTQTGRQQRRTSQQSRGKHQNQRQHQQQHLFLLADQFQRGPIVLQSLLQSSISKVSQSRGCHRRDGQTAAGAAALQYLLSAQA
jgi:hypothetical protein